MSLDFRENMIKSKIDSIKSIFIIVSGKGGVGKTLLALSLALLLSKKFKVGLLDADLFGSSIYFIFNIKEKPKENKKGLIPVSMHGIKVFSIDVYLKDKPLISRGKNLEELMKEILALVYWNKLDYLIVDTPPGFGDILLTLIKYMKKKGKAIIITSSSEVSSYTVRKTIKILLENKFTIKGVIENMVLDKNSKIGKFLSEEYNLNFLGMLPFDKEILNCLNKKDINKLFKTNFFNKLQNILKNTNFYK